MKVSPLAQPEIAAMGWTHQIVIGFADLVSLGGANATLTIELVPVALGDVVMAAGFRLDTAFDASDAAINSLLLELGIGGGTAEIMPQKQLAVDGTEILAFVTANATDTMPKTFVAADTVDALFTVAGGATPLLNELTAGQVTIYLRIVRVDAA